METEVDIYTLEKNNFGQLKQNSLEFNFLNKS